MGAIMSSRKQETHQKQCFSSNLLLNSLFTLSMLEMETRHQYSPRRRRGARHNPHKPPVCLQECKTHTEKACCHHGKCASSLPAQIKVPQEFGLCKRIIWGGKERKREKKNPRKHPQVNLDIILVKGHLTIRKW